MRSKHPIRFTAGAALAGAVLMAAAGCRRTSPPKAVPIVEPGPGETGQAPSGHPAITPQGGQPITEAQVRSYVLSHRVPGTLQATDTAVVSVSFMTHQQVRALLHSANLGIPDQEPMCVVILSGKFVFTGPPGQTPTFPFGVEVFNARTGNFMQSGGLPRQPAGPR